MNATPTDIHFYPPSSSVLVALSSLAPPSPILTAAGVYCSDDHIPILFDLGYEPTPPSISCSTSSTSLCAIGQPGVIYRGSAGTFGPLHHQSQDDAFCWSPASPHSDPSWPIRGDLGRNSPGSAGALGPSQTSSTIQSCTPISPSPSTNSCHSPRLRRKFKFPIDCNDPTIAASKSWVSQVVDSQENDSAPFTKNINTLAAPPKTDEIRPPLLRQPPHCPSPPRKREIPLPVDHSQDVRPRQQPHSPREREISLPANLSWLKDTVFQLLIDQEGFRAIHPTFKLVGLLKQARGWDSLDGGLALFRPIKRETFIFHYAPLDGLPILRRLTVNDDESRDYISRQASLSLKTTGVYTVQGSESPHLSYLESGDSNIGPDNVKLRWKFDYLVNDRLEPSGRIVDGEKIVTPLSFTCSPWLLRPSQAIKMKFMHIVKKSVTTKLVAEKLEPPLPAQFVQPPHVKPAVNHHRMWTLHRRVQSTQADEPKPKKKSGSVRRAGENSEGRRGRDENQEHSFVGRRRRASSAGEGRRPIQDSTTPYPPANPLAKHIVPRAQLAELLNNVAQTVGTRGLGRELPGEFRGLSPAPRRT
ncbi:hypothetical protein B0H17DRAFT_1192586 [Mycena rosella]|uniref:Uncharacterized protein n=1 Tax=Mycena rosella TaxID=1033263 RepID=A0AAD7M8Z1_MYCRO|nr:hypothetical protein B0H17DRAFT_1192586 [Mycena rosella]